MCSDWLGEGHKHAEVIQPGGMLLSGRPEEGYKLGKGACSDQPGGKSCAKLISSTKVYSCVAIKLIHQVAPLTEEKGGETEMRIPKMHQVTYLIHNDHLQHIIKGNQDPSNSASRV